MKYKLQKLITVLLSIIGLTGLQAQQSINTTGGNASGSGGSVSYSTGQVVYQTHTGPNGSVTEGVQQPYEISVVTGIAEAKGITLSVLAYPNPATDYLILEVNEFERSDFTFQLYNMNGKLLQSKKITSSQTNIAVSSLLPASFIVKVIHDNQEIKTFIIIKK